MKQLMTLMGLFIITAWFSGCGGNNDNSGQANYSCQVGTSYVSGRGCVDPYGNTVGTANFTYNNGFYADNYSGTSSIRIVNSAKMQEFFKLAMGVCDRAANNYGQASCQSYAAGQMDMIVQFPTTGLNTLLATFIAKPQYNPYMNYSAQLPSGWGMLGLALGMTTGIYIPDPKQYYGAYRNPLQLEMAVSLINNSAGFSANGYGDAWTGFNRTKLTIEVAQGKVQDYQLPFTFKIQDVPAAQGVMSRCRTTNCGL